MKDYEGASCPVIASRLPHLLVITWNATTRYDNHTSTHAGNPSPHISETGIRYLNIVPAHMLRQTWQFFRWQLDKKDSIIKGVIITRTPFIFPWARRCLHYRQCAIHRYVLCFQHLAVPSCHTSCKCSLIRTVDTHASVSIMSVFPRAAFQAFSTFSVTSSQCYNEWNAPQQGQCYCILGKGSGQKEITVRCHTFTVSLS
jgi:hypothetical protein